MNHQDQGSTLFWECSCRLRWHSGERPLSWDGRCPFNTGVALVDFMVRDAYSRRMSEPMVCAKCGKPILDRSKVEMDFWSPAPGAPGKLAPMHRACYEGTSPAAGGSPGAA